jgi:hypothetical protein
MSDYVAMAANIDNAIKSLESAEAEMLPVASLKQLDAYLLGFLRCCKSNLQQTKTAILDSSSYRKAKQKSESIKTE